MRIIHWIKQFYPYMGGGETALYELAKQIENEPTITENIIITTRLKGTRKQEKLFKKTKIIRISIPTDYNKDSKILLLIKNTIRDFTLHKTLKKYIDNNSIIHVHGPMTPPILLRAFGTFFKNCKHFQPWTKFNTPVVMHYHAIPSWKKEFLKKQDINYVTKIIAVDKAIEKFLNTKKAIFIPNGVDTTRFKPYSKKPRKFLTYIGRLTKDWKGWQLFVKSTKELKNTLIIGHGPEEDKVKNVFNGKLLTNINNNNIPEYYAKTNILVCPLINLFGISRVVLEGMASECIVIKSDYDPDSYPIINGITGFTFKSGNPDDLKKIIDEVTKLDKTTTTKIRKNARKIIEKNFEITEIAKKIIKEYKNAKNEFLINKS
ncbi:MAG: glycosyltransferase family 4 protein [Nanoarchaeota archaeon]|nr:glycosyltransferase family 4 protein [Nanoarchaeota archaeon]